MKGYRSDLALEAAENLGFGQKNFKKISGVRAETLQRSGYEVTDIHVENAEGAEKVGKPIGRYVTVDLRPYFLRESDFFRRGAECLASLLRELLPPQASLLVAGIGNRALTADAVGPLSLESLLVTRHMVRTLPQQFSQFTPVSALAAGVAGSTGMETLELLRGVTAEVRPAAVVAIDALAASNRDRLCATVQIGSTGLIPGSGVGNHRAAVNEETLGVPVIAIGVPTVMELPDESNSTGLLFITPRDIDSRVRELSRLIGYGITLATQPDLTVEDITGLLS